MARLRDPGLIFDEAGAEHTGRARCGRLARRARRRVRLRAGRRQVAVSPRRAGAARGAGGDRRLRLAGQRADPGPDGGDRRRRQPAVVHRRVGRHEPRAGARRARHDRADGGRRARRRRARAHAAAGALPGAGRRRPRDRNVRGRSGPSCWSTPRSPGCRPSRACATAAVAEHPDGREAAYAIWAEGVAVGEAEGVTLETCSTSSRASSSTATTTRARADDGDRGEHRSRRCCRTSSGPRHRGRRGQRRRRAAGREHGIATPFNDASSSSCTRWSAASAPRAARS